MNGKPIPLAFGAALLLISVLAQLGPLQSYPLTAHMLRHFLLVMLVPPLVISGLPETTGRQVRIRPVLSWMLGIGAMAVWHWPAFFNAAMRYPALHAVEQLSFFVTA